MPPSREVGGVTVAELTAQQTPGRSYLSPFLTSYETAAIAAGS